MTRRGRIGLVAVLCAVGARGQDRSPHIGYVYPAGGPQDSSFQVTVGGQFLDRADTVYFTGQGVSATVVEVYRVLGPGDGFAVSRNINAIREQRRREAAGQTPTKVPQEEEPPKLPDHPMLRGFAEKTEEEFRALLAYLYDTKRQPNAQIGEQALLQVTIAPDAPPGDRELRLKTPNGLTNPLIFQVGALPEAWEVEPNGTNQPDTPPLELPIVINGQILPGDIDRFPIQARAGQRLVIEAQARRLIPYLADAVPGWFQATMALYGPNGREVAYADDYDIDPDPVLLFEVPADGVYQLEIRDSIYRGREDFVYRITVGEQPFVTAMFPLGGPTGVPTLAGIVGWNLPGDVVELDTQPGRGRFRQAMLTWGEGTLSNLIWYAVDSLPECDEVEPNDCSSEAQAVELPVVVNGQIAEPGDVDVFAFSGRRGEEIVADVTARRLHSPLDSLLRLCDHTGQVLAWNDDHEDRETGLTTHHADSHIHFTLPADGLYRVELSDAQHQGGPAFAYRLRLGPPEPDFSLRVTPASINVPANRGVPIWVHALRKDGFDDDILLGLVNPPSGFGLVGGWVPRGRDRIRVTLTGPPRVADKPIELRLAGAAMIGGQRVVRQATPAEDLMQAFAYRHLVPAQQLQVLVVPSRGLAATVVLTNGQPIRIPIGGSAPAFIQTTALADLTGVSFELSDPPKGVSIGEAVNIEGGVAIELKADEKAQPGSADNLIVEVSREVTTGGQGGQPVRTRRVQLGMLPAIPVMIGPR